ncbi:hypothetical protein AwWohl_01860 [Gammaproteobacteria bacterium]|nr:hypothetical protein AwWohl_01860 [Gammaproteobacteria bacterium]
MLSFFSWNGRIGRLRYLAWRAWMVSLYLLISFPILLLASGLSVLASLGGESFSFSPVFLGLTIQIIVFSYFAVVVDVKRLHDLNKSSWWVVLTFVPIANILLITYLLFSSGSDDHNDYGASPPENSVGVHILAWIPLAIVLIGILIIILYNTGLY